MPHTTNDHHPQHKQNNAASKRSSKPRSGPSRRQSPAEPMSADPLAFWWELKSLDAGVAEATLDLPLDDYRAWLGQHAREHIVGVTPSAAYNPLAGYLYKRTGIVARLQTDGVRAWVMLQLTRPTRDTDALYLRLLLPAWTVPLALEYTAFAVQRTSGNPQQKEVCAMEALSDVRGVTPEAPAMDDGAVF